MGKWKMGKMVRENGKMGKMENGGKGSSHFDDFRGGEP
jgi:hypothetical protein